jgi:quercetin dioxygenase-like cupin family protein
MDVDRPVLVTNDELRGAGTATPGVARFEAFGDENVWVGRVENAPHQASDWHVHPGHDTYAYCIRGRFFVEFGRAGFELVEMAPGDFALIPKGVVHREGNAGADPTEGIAVRVGQGPVTVTSTDLRTSRSPRAGGHNDPTAQYDGRWWR